MNFKPILLLFLFPFGLSLAQNNYQSPLDIPLELAANFGELRPHHFHMGLDFKTKGKEGFTIRSIQEGYVSRIKVGRGGYGKMVQIAHPNGQSSVYAHCQSFTGAIDSLLKIIQRREQSEEVEIYLKKDEIKVKRGQIIAISGNTGGSTAPHLHFELRDTETEEALNPLLHGFFIADHQAPKLFALKIYALSEEGFPIPGKELNFPVQLGKNGNYQLPTSAQIPVNFCDKSKQIAFAIDAIDQFDNSTNRCGIYKTSIEVNGVKQFSSQLDRIPFEATRDINCHMDHEAFLQGKDFHRLFVAAENDLHLYPEGNGFLRVEEKQNYPVKISIQDARRNTTTLEFELSVASGFSTAQPYFKKESFYFPEDAFEVSSARFTAKFSPHTLYTPLEKSLFSSKEMNFASNRIPVQRAFELVLKENVSAESYLQLYSEKGRKKYELIEKIGQQGYVQASNLGKMALAVDKKPPLITVVSLTGSTLKWSAKDYETDIASYDLFIDEEWQLLEYESKLDLLFYKKPSTLKGIHKVKIILQDEVGNTAVWEKELTFE